MCAMSGAAPDTPQQAATKHFDPRSKKGRGKSRRSLDLIEAMHSAAEAAQPITGRGIGYKLFTAGLIPSMARSEMQRVYRLLKEAREQSDIPWGWIVDETRALERTPTWDDPKHFADCAIRQYRLDSWNQQPVRCEVWSEKGTVRGVLQPVLDRYGVGFRAMHAMVNRQEVLFGQIVHPFDQQSLSAPGFNGWPREGLTETPELRRPEVAMNFGSRGLHRDSVVRNNRRRVIRIGAHAFRSKYAGNRQGIDETLQLRQVQQRPCW